MGIPGRRHIISDPVPVREMELLSPDEKAETSVLYQNPYWSTKIGEVAEE